MKNYLITVLLISTYFSNAQNNLLNADFWKKTPDLNSVKAEIAKDNSPSEANKGNHDVVSIAINNGAPLETILFLLEQDGNSVKKTTHDGRIYLHWAASKGNVELVKVLLEKGSEINRTDDKGAIPILFAASNGQLNSAVYELLFKAGNNPKQKFQNGANLLLLSIANDKELKLADYLSKKGLTLFDKDDFGNTAFNYAAKSGDVKFLKSLIAKKVKYDDRALIFASQGTRTFSAPLETYKYLIDELKLKANAIGDNGENALHNLVKKQKQEEIISYLLEKGADVNHQDKEGNSVLMNAVKGNLTTIQTFFDKVKNVNTVNSKGLSALALAINSGTPEVAEFLLKNGANTAIYDNNGNNLAFHLIQSFKPGPTRDGQKDEFGQKLDLLKQSSFDIATPQKDGNTLYHLAVAKNDLGLIKKIENFGIDINAKNKEGMTALHKAALVAKDDSILKYLVSKGAKKEAKTEFDETAYDLASENETLSKNKTVIDFLK
jgi:ankyrin repeat protein